MRIAIACVGALLLVSPAATQGRTDYLNFEVPLVKPMTIARVGGHDYLLVANTPDSSVEVWDTSGPAFVHRVAVGQEPVSVVWNAALSRFYTANMLGDSISVVRLAKRSANGALEVHFERTEFVGDEPMMIAFAPDNRSLFVTHDSTSSMGWRDALTLAPIVPGLTERIDLVDSFAKPNAALEEPRMVLRSGTRLFVLGFRGGHSFFHDFDLFGLDLKTFATTKLGGLGSMKSGMALARNGDLWVIGADAMNQLRGVDNVAAAKTGFVRSLVHRVAGAGTAKVSVQTRDLNADANGNPVPKAKSLAHPMDIALLDRGKGVEKVFVAAMHSDRVGVIVPNGNDPRKWVVRTIEIPVAKGSTATMSAPRGLALKLPNPGQARDPGLTLYVLNRVDHSFAVVDPKLEKMTACYRLKADPTPMVVRKGRTFLYSAKLSGNGFVACASCHIDGRTDGLAWDLSEPPSAKPTPIASGLFDGVTDSRLRGATTYPVVKGAMVTQPLQGLVNWEVEEPSQWLLTNAPYHWRADTSFIQFNGAFVRLHHMKNLAKPNEPARGISKAEMKQFEAFVNSISFPPNPEQPLDRRYSGDFGSPDKADGSGGALGLKLFHTERLADGAGRNDPVAAGRSCVQCHFLPEGSNNRITRIGVTTPQPVETPQLRGIRQKEAVIEHGPVGVGTVTTGEFGLEHQGAMRSINDFIEFVFGHDFRGTRHDRLAAIIRFTREFDTGVAPLVGFPLTIDKGNAASAVTRFSLDFFAWQADEANVGVTAQAWVAGGYRGFWFDPITGSFVEEGGASRLNRATLLALLAKPEDRLVVQATPLGSERRLASRNGSAVIRRGPAPSRLRLEPFRPSVAWRDVPRLTKNWKLGWTGVWSGTTTPAPEPRSLKALRLLQYGLIQDAGVLRTLRHEAPRRLRVSGFDIRPGARLVLDVPNDPAAPPPYNRGFRPMIPIIVRLHATAERTAAGAPIWESAVELDAQLVYVLALGGPAAPGVKQAAAGALAEPPPKGSFDPIRWNKHWVWVLNEDGTYATGGWQPVRLR